MYVYTYLGLASHNLAFCSLIMVKTVNQAPEFWQLDILISGYISLQPRLNSLWEWEKGINTSLLKNPSEANLAADWQCNSLLYGRSECWAYPLHEFGVFFGWFCFFFLFVVFFFGLFVCLFFLNNTLRNAWNCIDWFQEAKYSSPWPDKLIWYGYVKGRKRKDIPILKACHSGRSASFTY